MLQSRGVRIRFRSYMSSVNSHDRLEGVRHLVSTWRSSPFLTGEAGAPHCAIKQNSGTAGHAAARRRLRASRCALRASYRDKEASRIVAQRLRRSRKGDPPAIKHISLARHPQREESSRKNSFRAKPSIDPPTTSVAPVSETSLGLHGLRQVPSMAMICAGIGCSNLTRRPCFSPWGMSAFLGQDWPSTLV